MSNFKTNLKRRIPEYFQGDNELTAYLEVCGEVFDEMAEVVKQEDVYRDYKFAPESRLALLARRFAFDPQASTPEPMMRGIIRDLGYILQTKGVTPAITWVFRLLSWDATIKQAWLPEPEKFDFRVKTLYPELYEAEDVTRTDYLDPTLQATDGGDPYTPDYGTQRTTDVRKMDYRNFLYGDYSVTDRGVYFNGKSIFATNEDATNLRILGEKYPPLTEIRKKTVVAPTPYLLVEVSNQDYANFTSPYVGDDGETYNYTTQETFRVAEILLNYLLNEFIRPANVKVSLIVLEDGMLDYVNISDDYSDVITAEGEIFTDILGISGSEFHSIENTINSGQIVVGASDSYIVGAPTFQPSNSVSAIDPLVVGDDIDGSEYVVGTTQFDYSHTFTFSDNTTEWIGDRLIEVRTPSRFRINTSDSIKIEGRVSDDAPWVVLVASVSTDTIYEVVDCKSLRLSSATNPSGTVSVDVSWKDQRTNTIDPPTLSINIVGSL